VASEAEYLEIQVVELVDAGRLVTGLDAVLPPGLDLIEAVPAAGPGSLTERIEASHWRVELPGVSREQLQAAVDRLLAVDECRSSA